MIPYHLRSVKKEKQTDSFACSRSISNTACRIELNGAAVDKTDEDFATSSLVAERSPSNVTFQVPFYLPPIDSSSSSSSSSTSSVNGSVDPALKSLSVAFHLPIPGSHSSSSYSSSTDKSTPVTSNTVLSLLQLGRITKANSPIRCTVLNYPSPVQSGTSVEPSEANSPFPVSCRVPYGFRVMEGESDEETTLYNEESDAPTDDEEALVVGSEVDSDLIDLNNVSLMEIAKSVSNAAAVMEVNDTELSAILHSTVNTKQYEKNKKGMEQRFFDTIDRFGGPLLQQLTKYAMDGFKKERLFYIKLRGDKTEEKRYILNACLVKVALNWRNLKKGRDFGKHYQPSSWETKLKYLFAVFRRRNILFNHMTDFNGEGEFHSVLSAQWAIEMEKDPNFASGIGTSTFDGDADLKLRELFQQGRFNPFSTESTTEAYEVRKRYMIYVLGRFFLRRGKNEIAFTFWNQVKFFCTESDGVKYEYVEVAHKWDKTHKCKLGNTRPRDKTQKMPRIYANENDTLCPYRFIKFFRTLCHPSQERVLCYRASSDAIEEWQSKNKPYLYNPTNPIGGNPISDVTKKMARDLGYEDWEKCTGQGLRKMGITSAMSNGNKNIEKVVLGMSRHKSLQTSMRYQEPNHEMFQSYNRAILGKHIASPPRRSQEKKKVNRKSDSHETDSEAEFEWNNEIPSDDTIEPVVKTLVTKKPATVSSSSSAMDQSTLGRETNSKGNSSVKTLPRIIEAPLEQESESRAVSSLSGTASTPYDHVNEMAMVPHVIPNRPNINNSGSYPRNVVHPIYQNHHHESNHIQRNIFVQPNSMANIDGGAYYWDNRHVNNMILKEDEEKKQLAQKVKELEFHLANQKEKYDDMKQDLRDAKERAQKAEWRLMKGKCALM